MIRHLHVLAAVQRSLVAFALSFAVLVHPAAAEVVEVLDACTLTSGDGSFRWAVKTDPAVPSVATVIQDTTVHEMASDWEPLLGSWRTAERHNAARQAGLEQTFFRLRGSVQTAKLSADDGDVHLELADTDDPMAPRVIVEIPQGPAADGAFCGARQALFTAMGVDVTGRHVGRTTTWTTSTREAHYHLGPLWVEVVGKAFYDGWHCDAAGKASSHGSMQANATCWELHPVVSLRAFNPDDEDPDPEGPAFNPAMFIGQGDHFNCADFLSQAQAQAVLRADPRDPNRLDPDRDGIACRSNPTPRDLTPVPR